MSRKKRKKRKPEFPEHIPQEFLDRLEEMFGAPLAAEIRDTFTPKPTTFRINTFRSSKTEVLGVLDPLGYELDTVPWQAGAYIMRNKEKKDICDLEIYTDHKIYLQSLASMVPTVVLDSQPGERVLDLTAAPGSKTSQIAAMMQQTGELVANDKNKIRFFKLKHNMEHQGVIDEEKKKWQFVLRQEHGAQLAREYPDYFDKILLDAPCSSEARFVSTNPKSFGYWKERKIKEMAYTQRELLLAAWGALKPGGMLVYSTCTFAPEENEVQISRLLERMDDAEVVPVSIDGLESLPVMKSWNNKVLREEVQQCLRVKPTADIEGFFIAKLQKVKN